MQGAQSPLASSCLSPGFFSSQPKRHTELISITCLSRQTTGFLSLEQTQPHSTRVHLENLSLSGLTLCSQFLLTLPSPADVDQGPRLGLEAPKRSGPLLRDTLGAPLGLQLDPSG